MTSTGSFSKAILCTVFFGVLFLLPGSNAYAQNAGDLDMSFNLTDTGFGNGNGTGSNVNSGGDVLSIATQPDGKFLLGGQFGSYKNQTAKLLCRIFPNGDLDPTFQLNQITNGQVEALAIQADGKILAGGFIYLNGQTTANSLYRFNPDGSLDNSFSSPISIYEKVFSIELQPDGKIIIGGSFTAVQGIIRNGIARLHPNGSLDHSFDPGAGFDNEVYKVALRPNGQILVGGRFTQFNNSGHAYFACLNPNGTLDPNFTAGINNVVHEIELDQNNRILLGGFFSEMNGVSRQSLLRLHPNGTLDSTFTTGAGLSCDPPFALFVGDIDVKPDGKIAIVGSFTKYDQQSVNSIVTLNPDGSLDQNFITKKSYGGLHCLAVQPDGELLVGGSSYFVLGGISRYGIGKLKANGEPDVQFNLGTGLNADVSEIVAQPDGKILVGGMFELYFDQIRHGIVRLNGNGSIDPDFGNHLSWPTNVGNIFLLPSGKMLVSGSIHQDDLNLNTTIARLHENGTVDTSFFFDVTQYGLTYALAAQPDGKLIAVRYVDQTSSNYITSVVRLHLDGSIDSTFESSLYEGQVRCAIIQPSGKILIGGGFRHMQHQAESNMQRLNSDGTLDPSFSTALVPGAKLSEVYAMVTQADGKILVNATLYVNLAPTRSWIVRLHENGNPDLTFDTGTAQNEMVWDMKVQPNGQLLLAGDYPGNPSFAGNGINRLHLDGSFDMDFHSGLEEYERVTAIEITPIDKILIGGDFMEYNGIGRNRLARLFSASGGGIRTIKSYPVPFTKRMEVQIQDGGFKTGTATLHSAQGKLVETKAVALEAGQFSFAVSDNLERGIYILRVQLEGGVHIIKVAKN